MGRTDRQSRTDRAEVQASQVSGARGTHWVGPPLPCCPRGRGTVARLRPGSLSVTSTSRSHQSRSLQSGLSWRGFLPRVCVARPCALQAPCWARGEQAVGRATGGQAGPSAPASGPSWVLDPSPRCLPSAAALRTVPVPPQCDSWFGKHASDHCLPLANSRHQPSP